MTQSIESGPLRNLLSHYLEARGSRRMPSRRDIDALKLGPVLPIIWVMEHEPAAGTFRYRIAGEEVNDAFGRSVTGHLLSELVAPDHFPTVTANFLRVIEEEAAMIASGPLYRCTDRMAVGQRLALPLSDDGEKAGGIVGATLRKSLVDLNAVTMQEQTLTFVSVDDLVSPDRSQAAGGLGG
ncbi:PAS domain-containing protein [Pelagibius litoralis]|uniref:PAS domain-containing protein n=1 Tax=Pelagibius litoralis TaxID=374515 RepID=A0A967EYP1_9PROT|nr:PAS domain-containing protein [Pelagibius litoralis]NIA69861.1 PAS domain-containing protein [Pelagibius litoralis]